MPLPILALAALAISAAATAGGAAMQAKAAKKQGEDEAKAAQHNDDLQREQTEIESARRRRSARRHIAEMRGAIAKSGVTIEGTPLMMLAEQATELERESINLDQLSRQESVFARKRISGIRRNARNQATAALISGSAQLGQSAFAAFGGGAGATAAAGATSGGAAVTMSKLRAEVAARGTT
jgi:hypothetical protein